MMPLVPTQPNLTHPRYGGSAMKDPKRAFTSTRLEAVPITTTRDDVAYDYDYDGHVYEIAGQGMPPGLPLNIARKRARQRQAFREALGVVIIGLAFIVGSVVALYVAKVFVDWSIRTFWVP